MRDPVIREALHRKILHKYHEDDRSIVLDEFGVNHGAIRADIAVVNGILHGYEIKGSADKLHRLPAQAEAYSFVFDKVTLVLSECHLTDAMELIPAWWGVYVTSIGKREGIHFHFHRKALLNKEIDKEKLAQLLWHPEAVELLTKQGYKKSALRQPRHILYKEIAQTCDIFELREYVRASLKKRKGWRDHSPL
jgi:hypothetical protein